MLTRSPDCAISSTAWQWPGEPGSSPLMSSTRVRSPRRRANSRRCGRGNDDDFGRHRHGTCTSYRAASPGPCWVLEGSYNDLRVIRDGCSIPPRRAPGSGRHHDRVVGRARAKRWTAAFLLVSIGPSGSSPVRFFEHHCPSFRRMFHCQLFLLSSEGQSNGPSQTPRPGEP